MNYELLNQRKTFVSGFIISQVSELDFRHSLGMRQGGMKSGDVID